MSCTTDTIAFMPIPAISGEWVMPGRYRAADLVGHKIGNRTILKLVSHSSAGQAVKVRVKCVCGRIETVTLPTLRRSDRCRTCGTADQRIKVTTHGDSYEKLYRLWRSMMRRCHGENDTTRSKNARWYADKGITVCAEWHDYQAFRAWALTAGYKPGLSLDRIRSGLGYSPANCEWVTLAENTRRHRSDVWRRHDTTPIEMLWGTT